MQPVALVRLVSPASPVPLAPPVPPVCLRVGFGFWVFLQRYQLHQGNQPHQWEQCGHYKRCQAPMKAVITLPPVETVKRERKVDRKRQREKGRYFYARVANALGRQALGICGALGMHGTPPKTPYGTVGPQFGGSVLSSPVCRGVLLDCGSRFFTAAYEFSSPTGVDVCNN